MTKPEIAEIVEQFAQGAGEPAKPGSTASNCTGRTAT